jgi:hypothetical protein
MSLGLQSSSISCIQYSIPPKNNYRMYASLALDSPIWYLPVCHLIQYRIPIILTCRCLRSDNMAYKDASLLVNDHISGILSLHRWCLYMCCFWECHSDSLPLCSLRGTVLEFVSHRLALCIVVCACVCSCVCVSQCLWVSLSVYLALPLCVFLCL